MIDFITANWAECALVIHTIIRIIPTHHKDVRSSFGKVLHYLFEATAKK